MKPASNKTVSSDFAGNGMINKQTISYPDMNAIIRACKTKALTQKHE